jgi:MiaB-like tRNA modifying enzyme
VKLYFEAYGCTQNQGEARLMAELMRGRGHELVPEAEEADANVLVTCTVVETTERRMVKRMERLAAQGKPLVVAGCMAAAQGRRVRELVPEAKILPPRRWMEIAGLLEGDTYCGDVAFARETATWPYGDAIVPIAQGCAGRCTYCITRVARGKVTSYPEDALVAQVRRYVEAGVREIKLTGQDTAAYGMDTGSSLPRLVERIAALPGDFRVRVGMADPLTVLPVVDDLVAAFASPKVFKFLHLPVQSGDDGVLERMGREYAVADFLAIVRTFRGALPELTLSTDVIVGFPGETDEAFEETVGLIRRVRPDVVNVTRFSPRAGTPAATFPDQVVGWRAKERSRRLVRVKDAIGRAINETFVDRRLRILTTEEGKGDTTIARSDAYKQVVLDGRWPLGEFLEARIDRATAVDLRGHVVS